MISRHVAQTAFIDFADLEFQWQWLHATLNNTPDLYLDDLHEELKEECGVSVSLSTIWQALVRSGYSMKKVHFHLIYSPYSDGHIYTGSLPELQLNEAQKNRVNLQHALAPMKLTNLCLLMRVQLTGEQHIVEGLGRYVGGKLREKCFSAMADGKYLSPSVFTSDWCLIADSLYCLHWLSMA
jgi:hypothetical protein